MARGRPIGERKRQKFLEGLRETGRVKQSARLAGSHCPVFYRQRQRDPEFAKAWDEALEIGLDRLEDEAVRRAVDGTDYPVFYQGQVVGHVRRFSDALLMFMLKSRRPEKYGGQVSVSAGDDLRRLLEAVDGSRDLVVEDDLPAEDDA